MYDVIRVSRPLLALALGTLLAGCRPIVAPTQPVSSIPAAAAPDDAAQGRLRVSNCVFHGRSVDLLVNGEVPVNGGMPQTNLGGADIGGYLYLDPGTYSVALTPTGQDITQALLGPLDVAVEAGHRYTLAMLGQRGDPNTRPMLIDETAAYQSIGKSPVDSAHISINNVKGLEGLDIVFNGTPAEHNIPYGEFQTALWPVGTLQSMLITVGGAPDQVIDGGPGGYNAPGSDSLDCFTGTYPGKMGQTLDTHSSTATSTLGTLAFLASFSGKDIDTGSDLLSFDTFLQVVKTAGMTDTFASGTPYLLFVPTDEAFAALPSATRDAILSDPKAAADMLRAHIVPGYYPYGSLASRPGGGIDRTVTNMLGQDLVLLGGDGLIVNHAYAGNLDSTMVANGIRLQLVTKVQQPGTK